MHEQRAVLWWHVYGRALHLHGGGHELRGGRDVLRGRLRERAVLRARRRAVPLERRVLRGRRLHQGLLLRGRRRALPLHVRVLQRCLRNRRALHHARVAGSLQGPGWSVEVRATPGTVSFPTVPAQRVAPRGGGDYLRAHA